MFKRIAFILLFFSLTSCEELDIACTLVELVIPDQHHNITEEFSGEITNLKKWWTQFDGTTLGKLLELAIDNSPLLESARNQLREVAFKYGMKPESVSDMVKNLDQYIKVSILSPDSMKTQNGSLSVNHVMTNDLPTDFLQGNKNYLRLFKFELEVDLFGKNKSWKQAAENDILSVMEIVKDTWSIIRLAVAKDFLYIRSHQTRRKKLRTLDCDCRETVQKIHERVKAGLRDSTEYDEALDLLNKAEEMVFHSGMSIKKAFHSLMLNTGINSLEQLVELVGEEFDLPKVDQNVFAGTPMDVVLHRSDVKSALNIFRNVCGLMGMSLADKFPKIIIDSTLETTAKSIFDILNISNFSFAYGYHLKQNIFEQAKVKAKINMYQAKYKKAQSDYKKVVSAALVEVADIMINKSLISKQIFYLNQDLEIVEKKLISIRARLEATAEHLVNSLRSENEKFLLIDNKISLESEELISTMELVTSLGGS